MSNYTPNDTEALLQALHGKVAELEAANQALQAFSASVAHDLRVPLRFVNTFAYQLVSEFAEELPPQALHYAELIQEGTRQMTGLVEELLAFSQWLNRPVHREAIDMTALAEAVWFELTAPGGHENVKLEQGELGATEADPVLVRQILANLLANALKFSRRNETPRITLSCVRAADAPPVYTIGDNGVGFAPEQADVVFDLFQRTHQPDEFEGYGVGLALVKQLVERHGGRVWAEGAVGEGAAFHFTLAPDVTADVRALRDGDGADG